MFCFLNPGLKQIIQIFHVNCQGQVYMRVVGNDDLLSDLFPSYQQRYIYIYIYIYIYTKAICLSMRCTDLEKPFMQEL
jgi:hypothetical protein